MGLNFDSFSAKFGNMFILQLWVTKILHFFSGTESWILSTRFEENMFDLHVLAQLKISGAETWLLRQNLKETYIIFNFGPHPGKSNMGVKFGYFHQIWTGHSLSSTLGPTEKNVGVQTGILCVKVWNESNLSSALGPNKKCSSWWGSKLNTPIQFEKNPMRRLLPTSFAKSKTF